MAIKKFELPEEPTWDSHPVSSDESRERRNDLQEWENDCAKALKVAWTNQIDIDWDQLPRQFQSLQGNFQRAAQKLQEVQARGWLFDPGYDIAD